MTPDPQNPDPQNPDARIDQVLNALRTTAPPAGLEQRVAHRLANAIEARTLNASPSTFATTLDRRTPSFFAVILNAVKDPRILLAKARRYPIATTPGHAAPSFFAVILTLSLPKGKDPRILLAPPMRYALAAASLLAIVAALSLFVLHAHHQSSAPSQTSASVLPLQPSANSPATNFARNPTATEAQAPSTTASFEGAGLQSRRTAPTRSPALAAEAITRPAATPPPTPQTPPPTDPDAIALAETLAPSRTASPNPLTQQERLMLAVLHSGNQQGIAALDPAKRDALLAQNELAFNNFFAPPTPAPKTGDKE